MGDLVPAEHLLLNFRQYLERFLATVEEERCRGIFWKYMLGKHKYENRVFRGCLFNEPSLVKSFSIIRKSPLTSTNQDF